MKNKSEPFQIVDGKVVQESLLKILRLALLGVFVLAPLGAVLIWAWWTEFKFLNRQISWVGAVFGAVSLSTGVLLVPVSLWSIIRREKLILGKEFFQVVVGEDRVTHQIPYRNIEDLELVHNVSDYEQDFIGILLNDLDDPDTLCPEAKEILKMTGWHFRITKNIWLISLQQLCNLIRKRIPQDPT